MKGLDDGTLIEAELRVLCFGNAAVQPYYTTEVRMFVHTFDDGERVLLVEQQWMGEADEREAEQAKDLFEGMPADSDHHLLEDYEVIDGLS